ncbi:Levodione [Fonsecaea erecta]|uniref:Levodione n=1 Tax=Fonsecaea erecta TaxID=1367422 RepID=A0A178ZPK7_9EURO|nr:Levodione [Fonsecaea erecta]OAP61727.1 Levodione [Fonsecaea erecta]
MASLKGKVIAITGAAGGIGSVTAARLASRGASLALADMDEHALNATATEIRGKHEVDILTTKLDVTVSKQVDDWIAATVKRFGKLSGGVNLAGTVGREIGLKAAHEVSDADFDLVMAINVRGLMACQRAQLQHIDDGGSIVNAASVAGKIGIPNLLAYTASKHAVIGMTRTAAVENGHRNVRVNAVAPGSIDTKMLGVARDAHMPGSEKPLAPINRLGKPEEVAALIAFLLSDESTYTTGAVYTIDGGMTP